MPLPALRVPPHATIGAESALNPGIGVTILDFR